MCVSPFADSRILKTATSLNYGHNADMVIDQQILRHRASRNRSPQTAYLETAGEAVYPVLPLPDPGGFIPKTPFTTLFLV
jgi:hypothetical protein